MRSCRLSHRHNEMQTGSQVRGLSLLCIIHIGSGSYPASCVIHTASCFHVVNRQVLKLPLTYMWHAWSYAFALLCIEQCGASLGTGALLVWDIVITLSNMISAVHVVLLCRWVDRYRQVRRHCHPHSRHVQTGTKSLPHPHSR